MNFVHYFIITLYNKYIGDYLQNVVDQILLIKFALCSCYNMPVAAMSIAVRSPSDLLDFDANTKQSVSDQ